MANVVTNPGTAVQPPVKVRPVDAMTSLASDMYTVELFVKDGGNLDTATDSSGKPLFPLRANLDEKINVSMSSQWDSPFGRSSLGDLASKLFGGKVTGEAIDVALGAAGFGSKLKAQSAQIWTGSSPMTFSFTMKFNAVNNTESEIRDRHMAMLQLCAPSEFIGSGSLVVLRAPGPTIVGSAISPTNSRCINLRVGNYLYLRNVVVKNVSSDVDTLFDEHGIPIAMSIAVEIESFYSCFTSEDIKSMFSPGGIAPPKQGVQPGKDGSSNGNPTGR